MRPARSRWPLFCFVALFAGCVAFAYVWFQTSLGRTAEQSAPELGPRFWLVARTNLGGYRFVPEPVAAEVKSILGTTNVFAGRFERVAVDSSEPDRVTVFLASWPQESQSPMSILAHTPDICWTQSGWKPVEVGLAEQIKLAIPRSESAPENREEFPDASREVRFKCRAFASAQERSRELAVWCILVDGRPMVAGSGTGLGLLDDGRQGIIEQLGYLTKRRLPVRGRKQFARYSMPIEGDAAATLEQVKRLVPFGLK